MSALRKTRDMSKAQFDAALKRHGMRRTGFMGYVEILPGHSVHPANAGDNRRAQLAYLIRKQYEAQAEKDALAKVQP